MKNNRSITCLTLFILLQTACSQDFFETVIPLDLPEDSDQITLNCLTDTGQNTWVVRLTHSASTLDEVSMFPRISDATLQLFANNVATGSFVYDTISYYSNENQAWYIDSAYVAYQYPPIAGQAKPPYLLPQTGINYTLKATAPNLPPVEASMTIPNPVPIQSVTVGNLTTIDNQSYYPIDITFQDPPNSNNEPNYYFLLVRQYINPIIDPISGEILSDTIETCNCFYTRKGVFNQNDFIFDLNASELIRLDGREPFSNQLFAGKQHTLQIFVPFHSDFHYTEGDEGIPTSKVSITLGSQNKERYFYRESRNLQNQTENNPFAEPVTVYNNVEGGFGIFAGYSSNIVRIELP